MSSLSAEMLRDGPLAYWRMGDEPFDETTYRYNIAPNPSFEVDSSGGLFAYRYGDGSSSHFATSRVTSGGQSGSAFYRATSNQAWSFNSWIATGDATPVVGQTYMVSMYVKSNRATTVACQVNTLRADNSISAVSNGDFQTLPANTWTRISRAITVPDGSIKLRGLAVVPNLQNGDTLDVDSILYELATTLGAYFDGSSANGTWDGTSGKSASRQSTVTTRRYLLDKHNVFQGNYSSSGVTYQVADFPEDGDGAAQFAVGGSATIVGGNDAWNLGTVSGEWTIEFLARMDTTTGGRLLGTDKWEIVATTGGGLTYRPVGGSGPAITGAWSNGVWHHYVFTFDGEGLVIYVDGSDVNTFFSTNIDATASGSLVLAGGTAVTLDEVAVYSQALNDGRVTAHYIGISEAFGEIPTASRIEPAVFVLSQNTNELTRQLTALIQFSGGVESSPLSVLWSTSDPDIADVDEDGLVTGLDVGTATITATMPDYGLLAFADVTIVPPDPIPTDEGRAIYSDDSMRFVYGQNPDNLEAELLATTHEWWEVDPGRLISGQWIYDTPISLATLAYNIATLQGREGIPVADGENVRIAARAGRRWIPKTPDQKQLSLAMWVQGTTPAGDIPTDIYLRTQFWENYNKLKQLFAVWDRQILLTRRVPTRYGIIKMYAWVEPASTMDLSPTGPMRATFSIDLIMADPFWAGDNLSSADILVLAEGGLRFYPRTYLLQYGSHGSPGIYVLRNEGTHDAKLKVTINGPCTNPTLKNLDTRETFRLIPDVPIEKGTSIVIDFWEKSILLNGVVSKYWWMDRTTDWLTARPGYQRLQFAHEGYDEDCTVKWEWQPSYL